MVFSKNFGGQSGIRRGGSRLGASSTPTAPPASSLARVAMLAPRLHYGTACASLVGITNGVSSSAFHGNWYRNKEGHPDSALNTTTLVFSLAQQQSDVANLTVTLHFPPSRLKLVKDVPPVQGATLVSVSGSFGGNKASCEASSTAAGGHCIILRLGSPALRAESSRLELSPTRADGRPNPAHTTRRPFTLEVLRDNKPSTPSISCAAFFGSRPSSSSIGIVEPPPPAWANDVRAAAAPPPVEIGSTAGYMPGGQRTNASALVGVVNTLSMPVAMLVLVCIVCWRCLPGIWANLCDGRPSKASDHRATRSSAQRCQMRPLQPAAWQREDHGSRRVRFSVKSAGENSADPNALCARSKGATGLGAAVGSQHELHGTDEDHFPADRDDGMREADAMVATMGLLAELRERSTRGCRANLFDASLSDDDST